MKRFSMVLAASVFLLAASAGWADVITVASFTGGSVTTPAAGFNNAPASLNLNDFGALLDAGSGDVGGGSVAGTLYYYFTAQSNATDYTASPPEIDGGSDFAGIQLWRGGNESLGVGNNWGAWAYSTFVPDGDLRRPSDNAYTNVHSGIEHLFVVKVSYADGGDSAVVWMDPDPADGDSQGGGVYTTSLDGDFSFDEVKARSGSSNNDNSWTFSNTAFVEGWADIPEPSSALLVVVGGLGMLIRRRAARKR